MKRSKSEDSPGCYMLCAVRPLDTGKHPRHYVGSSVRIGDRVLQHRIGSDARLIQVFAERGIDWECVRTWITPDAKEARRLEKRLKRRANYKQLCPHCAGEIAFRRGVYPVEVVVYEDEIPF